MIEEVEAVTSLLEKMKDVQIDFVRGDLTQLLLVKFRDKILRRATFQNGLEWAIDPENLRMGVIRSRSWLLATRLRQIR